MWKGFVLFCFVLFVFFPCFVCIFSENKHISVLVTSSSNSFALNPQVMLRVKESEVQYLKQEINSLKDELQAAQRVSR